MPYTNSQVMALGTATGQPGVISQLVKRIKGRATAQAVRLFTAEPLVRLRSTSHDIHVILDIGAGLFSSF
jgi:hypothetical protein